jgi:SAM-dependent methyltransferase
MKKHTYKILDRFYIPLDNQNLLRTKNIRLIPREDNRRGGKRSYAEWAHVAGIFQTLMFIHLDRKDGNKILDVGCGTGLLGIASEPFIGRGGQYVGIDVMKKDIDFCRSHFPSPAFEFIHLDTNNPFYAPLQENKLSKWPFEDSIFDFVTALSVWTHLNEQDALFYIREVNRVMKQGGKAMITFFLLDDSYQTSLHKRSNKIGRYHRTMQNLWIFDQPAYGSNSWFYPKWAEVPENAIGISPAGFQRLVAASGLELVEQYQGNWKEIPGVYMQDVVIFRKPGQSLQLKDR